MDAVEFLKGLGRLCAYYSANTNCTECPLLKYDCCTDTKNEEVACVGIVEQWAKEHPVKTRQSEFLKQWPDAEIGGDGLPYIAPCQLCSGLIHGEFQEDCENRGMCVECRHDFWLKEIE